MLHDAARSSGDIPSNLWLRIDYTAQNGTAKTWESAERRTRPKGGEIDGVGIVAILEKPTGLLCFLPTLD
jgi:hypothetical protein